MLNSENNQHCPFAEQIIDYIYNETTAVEREKFEAHLLNCLSCADEISGFGLVRSSISELRKSEDFVLTSAEYLPLAKVPIEKISLLEEFKRLLNFSPMWATGFAAVLMGFLLIWLFFGNSKNETAANKPVESTLIVENKAVQNENKEADFRVELPKESSKDFPSLNESKVEEKAIQSKNKIARLSENPKQIAAQATKINNQTKANVSKKSHRIKIQETPTLSEFADEEDNSLRLSGLIDEIGTK